MHEMTPEVIDRKRQVCQEALDVIQKLDYGIGVRTGQSETCRANLNIRDGRYC
jgi:hypothetical protein